MKINKKSVRSLDQYASNLQPGQKFIIACKVSGGTQSALEKIGFPNKLEEGQTLVPKSVGAVTEFNALGRDTTNKTLPKVNKTYTIYKTWKDWHGYDHSGFQHHSRMVYQVTHTAGPIEAITIINSSGQLYAASRVIENLPANEPNAIHIINMFLEIFGQCEILNENATILALPKIKNLNWSILPKGSYPWSKFQGHVATITSQLPPETRPVIEDRLKHISTYNPDFIAIGHAGFSGYFVLGFETKRLFIFESIHTGNATYLFDDKWQEVSKLTKSEIINGTHHHKRITHGHMWKSAITRAITVG